ncbi:polyprenol monophosphomannose synthase [Salinibacterium hongtaonis]|uniref:Dolichol-phosphate mannosyltransferase n=1 Tax=Homoserinimonas hongtaonis TaxID=2079791 RepID=A0A2U1T0X4_9MICO|nr:polyprenol monophosphomannose synthase [Salinibacterium hongtaonis]PWB97502.1 dolichol-phosphate mannosyltransferase [Salinibacterium hongtaonis]
MSGVVIVVPTYNELPNLAGLVDDLHRHVPSAEILIVDDDSPDGTGQAAELRSASDGRLHVLHRATKDGLGAAYRAGFAWALAEGYDTVVQMDADGSHRAADVPVLLQALETADVVLGSRWVPGGSVVGWPRARQLLSRGGSVFARACLPVTSADVTGGFRAFRREALERIEPQTVMSRGYCFQIEMLWRANTSGCRVREVPIEFAERQEGKSKMSSSIVFEAMARVAWWGITQSPKRLSRPARQPTGRIRA